MYEKAANSGAISAREKRIRGAGRVAQDVGHVRFFSRDGGKRIRGLRRVAQDVGYLRFFSRDGDFLVASLHWGVVLGMYEKAANGCLVW